MELPVCPVTGNIGAALPDVDKPGFVTIGVAGSGIGDADGAAQTTTVPGVVGSEASGTGASVVSGAFNTVVAENGPGLFKGEITIAPGTVGRPIAVVPVVATCALLGELPNSSRANIVATIVRIITKP
jgi:hypothetical protein